MNIVARLRAPLRKSSSSLGGATVALLVFLTGTAEAASLRYAGVFGNSGEEGESLVQFVPGKHGGLGVMVDRYGSIWDRAGNGRINRYAVDGRLLASYPISKAPYSQVPRDAAVLVGDTIVMNMHGKLFSRSIDDPPEAEDVLIAEQADCISRNSHEGWIVAAKGNDVFLLNLAGETKPIATMEKLVDDVAFGPEGAVYVRVRGAGMQRVGVDPTKPSAWSGARMQWLNERWYSFNWHGTIYRFAHDFRRDPGVVLGGNSGSFLGRVAANYEISNSPGMCWLGGNLYATSGVKGVVHLLNWRLEEQRFEIVRRIGAVVECSAMTLDSQGRLWWGTGMWEWSDGPDAPLRHGVGADENRVFGSVLLENDVMVASTYRQGRPHFLFGRLDAPLTGRDMKINLPKNGAFSTLVKWEKGHAILVLDEDGRGIGVRIDAQGAPSGKGGGEALLSTTTPVKRWTSVSSHGKDLIGSADGHIIELAGSEGAWTETGRWNSWGNGPDAKFGERIYTTVNSGRLWVADTTRQRVLCFDLATRKLLASFGTVDRAGRTTSLLDTPELIVSNGARAAVFDAANQRILKVELMP